MICDTQCKRPTAKDFNLTISEFEQHWDERDYQALLLSEDVLAAKRLVRKNFGDRNTTLLDRARDELNVELSKGESGHQEFKSSVIWDVNQDKHSLVMRDEVLKEICAFLNADGGTIFCGVDDDGKILGLGKDLKHAGSKDRLSLILANSFGDLLRPHPVELIKMSFIDIDDTCILRIDVQPDSQNRYESPSTRREDSGKNIARTHVRVHASAKALEGESLINWWLRRKSKQGF